MGEQFSLGPRGSQPGCMSLSVPRGRLCEVTETSSPYQGLRSWPARALVKARFQTLSSRQFACQAALRGQGQPQYRSGGVCGEIKKGDEMSCGGGGRILEVCVSLTHHRGLTSPFFESASQKHPVSRSETWASATWGAWHQQPSLKASRCYAVLPNYSL